MPKILVISQYVSYHTVRPEAEIYIGLAKLGFDVHIMTSQESEYTQIFRDNGIHVEIFHPQKKKNTADIQRIRTYIIEHSIDILQVFNNKGIRAGIPAVKGLQTKLVLYRGYAGNVEWWNPISYMRFFHPRVDKIICNSQGVEKYLQSQMLTKRLREKTITINKGHRYEWYAHVTPIDIRIECKIPDSAFVLVNMANDRRMKGIPYLLEAMNTLPQELEVHLLLVGGGMDKPKYQNIIKKGMNPLRIHVLGHRTDALRIVAASDVFVLASIKGESITKSVIEAMSLGVTPLITNIIGNTELVISGECGLVVKSKSAQALADGIMYLQQHPNECKQMGIKAQKHIQTNLHTDQTILKYKELYESL